MKSVGAEKLQEGTYFVVDTLSYMNQITRFDVDLAMQTISGISTETQIIEAPSTEPFGHEIAATLVLGKKCPPLS